MLHTAVDRTDETRFYIYRMKIIPLYKHEILSLPAEVVSEKLSTATADELRVLLAVMLERSKILIERDAREQEDHTILRVYEHRRTGESFIVLDPRIRLENLDDVQTEVVALLSGTKTLGEVSRSKDSADAAELQDTPTQNAAEPQAEPSPAPAE